MTNDDDHDKARHNSTWRQMSDNKQPPVGRPLVFGIVADRQMYHKCHSKCSADKRRRDNENWQATAKGAGEAQVDDGAIVFLCDLLLPNRRIDELTHSFW